MPALERRLSTARLLVAEAGELAMRLRPAPGSAAFTMKGEQDWLTQADGAVEAFLAEQLAAAFPEDGFQGEETGHGRAGTLRWVVDPIAGTATSARGGARFGVSLGLVEDRTPLIGVIVAPALGDTYVGMDGAGATLNGIPIRAAATTDIRQSVVEHGWNPRRPDAEFVALVSRIRTAGAMPRLCGSGALGLAETAAGRIDAFVELNIHLWDCAAAIVLCREAGAFVSPFMDGDGPVQGGPILTAAPGIAAQMRAVCAFEEGQGALAP